MNITFRTLVALTCGVLIAVSPAIFAADHVDSPITTNDPAADITDIYTFVNPNDPNEYILVANVVPFANDASRFSDAVVYTFRLTNGTGAMNQIVCTFSNPDAATLDQNVTCTGPGDRMVSGPIGQINSNGDFRVFAGLRDDPFFFDFVAFNETLDTGTVQFTDPGTDFFAGLNVMSIVVGLPIEATNQMAGAKVHFNQRVWATTARTNGAGIGAGYTGAWYDPDQSGMGFQFEVLQPEPTTAKVHYSEDLLAFWYFFLDGEAVWLHGRGPVDGNTATVPLAFTTGGGNLGSFDEVQVERTEVGTLTVTGMDCDKAMIAFDSTDGRFPDIEFPIERLSEIKNLPCQFLVNGEIDRMGRPGITTVLIPSDTKDAYNLEHDPSMWASRFQDEIRDRLMLYDGLDGTQGNQLLDYDTLSAVLVDDRLTIATNVPNCGPYLAVELTPAGEDPAACGGRTLSEDVIDVTLTALVGSAATDGVDSNDVPFLDQFPFLAAPQ